MSKTLHELQSTLVRYMIDELVFCGVTNFFIAPGSRSSPLLFMLDEHPLASIHSHFDERGLGYMALGFAKGKKTPVCIVTTSGTAASNLLPAVTEAYYDEISLIVITCDRPTSMLDIGSNQTIKQTGMFSSYSAASVDLSLSEFDRHPSSIQSQISYLSNLSRETSLPVHLNLHISDPNHFIMPAKIQNTSYQAKTEWIPVEHHLSEEMLDILVLELSRAKNGVIVLGAHHQLQLEDINRLAEKLGWPVYADIQSNLRKSPFVVPYFLELKEEITASKSPLTVLHLGGRCVEHDFFAELQNMEQLEYIHVFNSRHNVDPYHLTTKFVFLSPKEFALSISLRLENRPPCSLLQTLSTKIKEKELHFEEAVNMGTCSQVQLPFILGKMQLSSMNLFLSNSLTVRYFNRFFYPEESPRNIFTQRGTSGIDGNISHVIGLSKSFKGPLLAILGDYAFLYDINSLLLLQEDPRPIVFIIVNNFGGGIFHAVYKKHHPEKVHRLLARTHNYPIRSIIQGFGFKCEEITSVDSLQHKIQGAMEENGPQFFELCTSVEADEELLRKIHGQAMHWGAKK